MAAFHVFDLAVSQRVFAVCGTSTRVLALHEQLGLGGGGAGEPFYHVVESPYEDFDDDFTRLRECEITLDKSTSTAAWRVDGHTVYEAHGTLIPERARIGFGIWTMLAIRDGRSRSLDGRAWMRAGASSVTPGLARNAPWARRHGGRAPPGAWRRRRRARGCRRRRLRRSSVGPSPPVRSCGRPARVRRPSAVEVRGARRLV